jgi:hypothetical protein
MELIPILSTIILVATISTFILAVGAYILFKIREDKTQRQSVKEPVNLHAEYIVPKEKEIKKVYVDDVIPPKSNRIVLEDRFKKVLTPEDISAQHRNFEEKKEDEQEIELPKEKFVTVKALNAGLEQNEFDAGEIKWR